ncbi:MAG: hypothetical protein ACRDZZ_06685 [Ilumatobacteraceae bacterium]
MRRFATVAKFGSTVRPWMLLLAGPVTWTSHFWLVYVLAETVCGPNVDSRPASGPTALNYAVLVATVLGAGLLVVVARYAYTLWRSEAERDRAGDQQFLAGAGAVLAGVFLIAILFVGLPAAVTSC